MHWIALQALPEPPAGDGAPGDDVLPDALSALGWWALQFTPRVAHLEDALLLEVSASERLWGGRPLLLRRLLGADKPVARLRYARGSTSLLALARLQVGAHLAPDQLPLNALVAARPHLATLMRLGCTRWGELRALPRAGVARRFGSPLLDALDRAYGRTPELYPWLRLPEVFEATLELAAQVETAPALLFGASRLLRQLKLWLQLRQRGVLALVLRWTMDARRNRATEGELILRTAAPCTDMGHLQRLLGEHLARLSLPSPALFLHLRTLETQALGAANCSLLPDEQHPGDSLHQLLERLSARLGPQQVLQWQARADHRPEQMQVWQPVSDARSFMALGEGRAGALQAHALYPTWLLATPRKLALRQGAPLYQGALRLLAGPQRLEAGWWGGGDGVLRDYFLARSEARGLLWIYRERRAGPGARAGADADWYLHGFFA